MADIQKQDRLSQQLISKPSNVAADLAGIMSLFQGQRAPQDITPLPVAPTLQAAPTAPAAAPLNIFDRIASTLAASGGGGSAPNFSPSIGVTGALGLEGFQALSGIKQAEARAALGQDQLSQRRAEAAQQQAQFEQGQALATTELQNRVSEANWKNQMSRIRFQKEQADLSPQELRVLDSMFEQYSAGQNAARQVEVNRLNTESFRARDADIHQQRLAEIAARRAGGGSGDFTQANFLLNLGKAHEAAGNFEEAQRLYGMAEAAGSPATPTGGGLGAALLGEATAVPQAGRFDGFSLERPRSKVSPRRQALRDQEPTPITGEKKGGLSEILSFAGGRLSTNLGKIFDELTKTRIDTRQ